MPGSAGSACPGGADVTAEAVKQLRSQGPYVSSGRDFLVEGCVMEYLKRKTPERPEKSEWSLYLTLI